ncbi:hypothetical protein [Pseudomonas alkylphenolica]|uniref:hypothetical protein n=1 Tax=Pseudomonas alkylphenolica TaxID=237609 RepID=UPI0018D8F8F7|nr:hypothetical protein [Pseudomonas alkylphenolica]MBH3426508.1 hypothetical protein [Pseudomonas alkylphenolica]
MSTILSYPAISTLTQDNLEFLSVTFPKPTRSQLIALRSVLNDQKAPWRTYARGLVSIDKDAMLKEVAFKCSPRTADSVSLLIDCGVCLQAVATTPLKIPMAGTEQISLRL